MLNDHPKGLLVAFFTNMGERFGFYTLAAIFTMFLQTKYSMTEGGAGQVYSIFMAVMYALTVFGGIIADRYLGYTRTIAIGMVVMFAGYLMLGTPTAMGSGFWLIICSLAVIAVGTGLFKGNLQALVGCLYDDPRFNASRDRGFNIFYMGINIGAMFAPMMATVITNWVMRSYHLFYNARIPALANAFIRGKLDSVNEYLQIAKAQDAQVALESLKQFSTHYINALSKSYHFAFGIACVSLIVSMLVFQIFRRHYIHADCISKGKAKSSAPKVAVPELSREQTRERMLALFLVFFVVIFFWMSFQQNAVCMTYFARDYTVPHVGKLTNFWFDLVGLLPIFFSLLGLSFLLKKKSSKTTRLSGGLAFGGFAILAYLRYRGYAAVNPIQPQIFQQLNPFYIVALTPLVIGFFSWLNRKGKEPSAPRKIGIGMLITAASFGLLILASLKLGTANGQVAPEGMLISPYWLISTYLMQTVAELFLSPMGISFVSRVSPPKYKGMMMGFWFVATAVGMYLVGIVASLWRKVPLWTLWTILVACCVFSAAFMFLIMKRMDRATQDA